MGTTILDNRTAPESESFGPEALDRLLGRLIASTPVPGRVISCYLQLPPDSRRNQIYLRWLKDRIGILMASLPSTTTHDQREAIQRDLVRILARVEDPARLPAAGGLALFACEDAGLFAEVPLPETLRSRLILDDTPWIAELVRLKENFRPVLVLALDRRHARFFVIGPWNVQEVLCIPTSATPAGKFHGDRKDSPGWGERAYHTRIKEEQHRFHLHVTEALQQQCHEPIRGFVLVGPVRQMASFTRQLPEQLRSCLLHTARLNPAHLATREIIRVAQEGASLGQQATLDKAISAFKETPPGLVTNDVSQTLKALREGRVRQLLVASEAAVRGFRCEADGHLTLHQADCGSGTATPVLDVIDDAIEEALRQDLPVACLTDAQRGGEIAPLAALLRYQ